MKGDTLAGVDTRRDGYSDFLDKWTRCRDVIAGMDAVHSAGERYLPKLSDQSPQDYRSYKLRAGFYNASWRTVSGLLGMMFRKPAQKELPGVVEAVQEDIDLSGTTLDGFVKSLALEVLSIGRVGVLVDHPETVGIDGEPTRAQAEALGLRPTLQVYTAENIINWRHRRVNNEWVLSQVVLHETALEPDGEFGQKPVDQWRVLDLDENNLYRVRVFRKRNVTSGNSAEEFEQVSDDIYPLMNRKPLAFIPFVIIGSSGNSADFDEPPLIDLIDMNLAHYRVSADYEHGCHFTGLPTPWVAGYQADPENPTTFYIGSTSAWVFPDPQAKAGFLEFTGQGLNALKENLDRKEEQMAILGARMIAAEKKVAETATTAAIHRTGENSVLASIAISISEAVEWALSVFAMWAGSANTSVIYQINRDYNPALLDAQQLTALLALVQAGKMSDQSFFEILQRADVQDPELTFEEEQERIGRQDAPPPPEGGMQ